MAEQLATNAWKKFLCLLETPQPCQDRNESRKDILPRVKPCSHAVVTTFKSQDVRGTGCRDLSRGIDSDCRFTLIYSTLFRPDCGLG